MAWRWVPDRAPEGEAVSDKRFPTQGEAESWLGEFYPGLLDVGVTAVTLYEEDRPVYGPMRLDSES